MTPDSIFILFFVFIIGFVAGWLNHAYAFFQKCKSNPDELIELLTKYKKVNQTSEKVQTSEQEDTSDIKVERHGDQLYIYTAEDDEFLAQGSTLQDALDNVQRRYPGRVFKGHLTKQQADSLGVSVK